MQDLLIKFPFSSPYIKPKPSIILNTNLNTLLKEKHLLKPLYFVLSSFTGQRPFVKRARTSNASFKLRTGNIVGTLTTIHNILFINKFIYTIYPKILDNNPNAIIKGEGSIGITSLDIFYEWKTDNPKLYRLLGGANTQFKITSPYFSYRSNYYPIYLANNKLIKEFMWSKLNLHSLKSQPKG